MKSIGFIDGLLIADNDGNEQWVESPDGIRVRMADTANPQTKTMGVLMVRSGGMIVLAQTDAAPVTSATRTTGADQVTPLSREAAAQVQATSDRPQSSRRRPAKAGGDMPTPVEPAVEA